MNPAEPAAGGGMPSFLPGPITDRETVEGWRQWRLNRHAFVPAPRLPVADYRLLSPRDRQLHDLHRAAAHANLPLQDTPMSLAVTRIMRSRLQSNALKHKPTTRAGLMITGGGYQGKTETACEIAASFEDAWLDLYAQLNLNAVRGTRDLHAPVAYVQTPVTAKPKSTCEAILDFFGADHHKMNLPQLTRAVRTASIIVWSRLTGSEHVFAPHPIRDQQPAHLQHPWRLSAYSMAARFRGGCTRPHDIALDNLLVEYARQVAAAIDNGEQPGAAAP